MLFVWLNRGHPFEMGVGFVVILWPLLVTCSQRCNRRHLQTVLFMITCGVSYQFCHIFFEFFFKKVVLHVPMRFTHLFAQTFKIFVESCLPHLSAGKRLRPVEQFGLVCLFCAAGVKRCKSIMRRPLSRLNLQNIALHKILNRL